LKVHRQARIILGGTGPRQPRTREEKSTFVTIAAEQFGTNLRATVATTVPNFVRGMVVPITLLFLLARRHFGLGTGAALVGGVCVLVALYALYHLEETFHKDLDYFEQAL